MRIALYGKFGFRARFLTPIMAAPARAVGDPGRWSRYSDLPEGDRRAVETACRELTDVLYDGLDLGAELRTVACVASAIRCFYGRARADSRALRCANGGRRVKPVRAAVTSNLERCGRERAARNASTRSSTAVARSAAAVGIPNLLAGVNLAREEAYLRMLAHGFRAEIQVVTMHRPNEAAYSRPGLYVLDDWR